MTGGAGFSKDSTSRFKQNRDLLRNSLDKYFKKTYAHSSKRKTKQKEKTDPQILKKYRDQTIADHKKSVKKQIAIAIAVTLIILYYIFIVF